MATNADVIEAWRRAFAGDPVSAFGGIVGINRKVTKALAGEIRNTKHPTSGQRLLLHIIVLTTTTKPSCSAKRDSHFARRSSIRMRAGLRSARW
jgi:hypothetical protein